MKRSIEAIQDTKTSDKINHHHQIASDNNNNSISTSEEPKLKKQAKQPNGSSYYELGCSYFDPFKKNSNEAYRKAMELFMKGAKEGCAECQHKIGLFYASGWGVEIDHSKAMKWYLKSAKVLSKSQNNIGLLYEFGDGVEQDYTKAIEWYLKAANNGDVTAHFNIGICYEHEQDYSKAMKWYLKAANSDNIGTLSINGEGVSQHYSKNIEWDRNETSRICSQFKIGALYDYGNGVPQDKTKAKEWYLKATSTNGTSDAYFNIGTFFEKGEGVEKSYAKAIEWYLKAAENESADAKYNIASLYLTGGYGVKKDVKKAIYWVAKCFDYDNFKFIEDPFKKFAIEDLVSSTKENPTLIKDEKDQQVIIRFKERDFKILGKYLNTSKYLSTMLSSNWKDFNEQEKIKLYLI